MLANLAAADEKNQLIVEVAWFFHQVLFFEKKTARLIVLELKSTSLFLSLNKALQLQLYIPIEFSVDILLCECFMSAFWILHALRWWHFSAPIPRGDQLLFKSTFLALLRFALLKVKSCSLILFCSWLAEAGFDQLDGAILQLSERKKSTPTDVHHAKTLG